MTAGWRDDVAAHTADIDPLAELRRAVADFLLGSKEMVRSAAAGLHSPRDRQGAMLAHEGGDRVVSPMPGIDIEHAIFGWAGDTEIRIGRNYCES